MNKTYIIGDIHGCFKSFNHLLFNVIKIKKDDTVFLLGDYIDRGQYSKEVLDLIMDMINKQWNFFPLIGNHELMLLKCFDDDFYLSQWMKNHGITTLNSFGIRDVNQMDIKYIDFIKSLKYYYILENYVLVHGGLNFGKDDPFTDLHSMVWFRNKYIDLTKTNNKKLIVGHTPVPIAVVKDSLNKSVVLLDGGCVYNKVSEDLGNLVALELNSMKLYIQKNIEE